jgi:5-methylcytosine-specific restriction endonuclease McrA
MNNTAKYRAKYYRENREKALERARLHAERNSSTVLIRRRIWAGKVNPGALPPWLTDEQREAMQWFYDEARRLTKETRVSHVVDHIHPLNGAHSCGLHVPWNLQVLTDAENKRKRFREDGDF